MVRSLLPISPPSVVVLLVFTPLVLFICFFDGPLYALYASENVPPNLLVITTLLLALSYWYAIGGHIRPDGFFRAVLIAMLFLFWWLMQSLFQISVYELGYIQLAFFVCLLPVVRAVFATDHGQYLAALLGRTLLVIHYLFTFYLILSTVLWYATGTYISIGFLLDPTHLATIYNYRPSGLSREPAWSALTLATCYLGIYYLYPQKRTGALVAMIVGFLLIHSGTAIIFLVAFFTMASLKRSEAKTHLGLTILLCTVSAALLSFLLWDRIMEIANFKDPSLMMRLKSIGVAFDVIRHNVILGVGYGNFREYAVYGGEFDNFINLARDSFYKSDLSILNYWAEMGVFSFLLTFLFVSVFYSARALPLMILPVLALVLYGTILLPQLFVLVAVAGALDYHAYGEAVRFNQRSQA